MEKKKGKTNKQTKLSKAFLLWLSFKKPQTAHRNFVENQYVVATCMILQLIQLIQHAARVKGEEGRGFFPLCRAVSVLFSPPNSTQHVGVCQTLMLLCLVVAYPAGTTHRVPSSLLPQDIR